VPPRLTLGLDTYGSPPGGDWRHLLDVARCAEDAGLGGISLGDHVVLGSTTAGYRWGKFPVPPTAPWLEALTVLTAIAAVTSCIRLQTGVLLAALRPAPLLAKSVATLDLLSGGRVDLGVGTGWHEEEYAAFGLDFKKRGTLLTDTLAACRALWQQTPASFESSTICFRDVYCEPKPVQARLPIWIGGPLNERNLERIVQFGDGWFPIMGSTDDDIIDGAHRLRQAVTASGRSSESIVVQAPPTMKRNARGQFDLDAAFESIPRLVQSGVTAIYVNLRAFCPDYAHTRSDIKESGVRTRATRAADVSSRESGL
jgi:probable F420-dependent oxidoreductase